MRRTPLLPVALALMVIIGVWLTLWPDPHDWRRQCPQPAYLSLRLTATPVERERSWKVTAEVESVDNQPVSGTLRLYLRRDSTAATLRYGDRLLAHGYADTARGMLYLTSDHYLVTQRDSTSFRSRCEALRMSLLRRMQAGPLDRRNAGVAEALTLGWRGDLDDDLRLQYRDSGIMHLLCVSGLHVGLLAVMVGWLMVWVGEERRGRIVKGAVQLVALWAFALLSGLAPATVRAALMFSLFIVSHMIGRRTDTMNLLAAAVIVMLVAKPSLLFDVGWQLSVSAVAGILLARPAMRLQHNFLWRSMVTSLAATLATLPVIVGTFHQLPLYFLLANIIIVPLAALILALALLYMALPCVLTATLLGWLLTGCDWLTGGIARLPMATVPVPDSPSLPLMLAVAVFFILFTINRLIARYQRKKETTLC